MARWFHRPITCLASTASNSSSVSLVDSAGATCRWTTSPSMFRYQGSTCPVAGWRKALQRWCATAQSDRLGEGGDGAEFMDAHDESSPALGF
jgi:hypothetical protein